MGRDAIAAVSVHKEPVERIAGASTEECVTLDAPGSIEESWENADRKPGLQLRLVWSYVASLSAGMTTLAAPRSAKTAAKPVSAVTIPAATKTV
jgi:hypothetical protein